MSEESEPLNPFAVATQPAKTALADIAAQREIAEVQAAVMMAKRFPRNQIEAVDRILQACARPGLAESAVYQYSRGGTDIEGPSIRLAEELARGWGNILCGITELSRSNGVSECLAYAWDLETNFRDDKRFIVKHWRDTKKGGYVLTDERDIYEAVANQGARRKRACILAVIPGDVQEAAVKQCTLTLKTKAEVTPERIKSLLEKFSEYGVAKEQVEKRIQRRIDAMTPAQMVNLGKIYNSLKEGMSIASDWFPIEEQDAAQAENKSTATDKLKERVRRTRQPAPETQPQAPQVDTETGEIDPNAAAMAPKPPPEKTLAERMAECTTVLELNRYKPQVAALDGRTAEGKAMQKAYNAVLARLTASRPDGAPPAAAQAVQPAPAAQPDLAGNDKLTTDFLFACDVAMSDPDPKAKADAMTSARRFFAEFSDANQAKYRPILEEAAAAVPSVPAAQGSVEDMKDDLPFGA